MLAFSSRFESVPKPEDPLELANQEAELEDVEAKLADKIAELERRKQKAHREWDTKLQELSALAKSKTHSLATEALHRFSNTLIPRAEKISERIRANSARRAALMLRKEAVAAEKTFISRSDSLLADIEEKLASLKEIIATLHARSYESETVRLESSSSLIPPKPVRPADSKNVSSTSGLMLQTGVNVYSKSDRCFGFVATISDKEVFVATCNTMQCNTEVGLEFNFREGKVIQARGIVRWTRGFDENTPDVFPGLGIEFLELAPEIHVELKNLTSHS